MDEQNQEVAQQPVATPVEQTVAEPAAPEVSSPSATPTTQPPVQSAPAKPGLPVAPLVTSVVITALLAIGITYAYQNKQNNKNKSDLQGQINNLVAQLQSARANATATPLATATPSTKTVATATPTAKPTPSPTVDPTASWTTYANTTGGFTFKYPSTVATPQTVGISSVDADPTSRSFSLAVKNSSGTSDASTAEFELYTPTAAESAMTLAQFVDSVTNGTSTKTATTFNGTDAIRVSFISGGYQVGGNGAVEDGNDVIFIKHGNYYLYIAVNPLAASKTADLAIINSVLATLTFN